MRVPTVLSLKQLEAVLSEVVSGEWESARSGGRLREVAQGEDRSEESNV